MVLPQPVWPTKASVRPAGDVEADRLEHRPVHVAEPDVVEGHGAGRRPAVRAAQRPRVGPLLHLDRRVQHLVHALAAGDGALREAGEPADHLRGIHEHHQVAVEGDQRAQAQAAVDHLASSVVQQERDGEVGDERDQRDELGAHACRRHARLEDLVAAVAELLELVVLAREDAHDARAHHVLLGCRRDVGDLLLNVLEDRFQALAEAHRDEQQKRQEGERHEPELPVEHQQDDGDGDHHHDVGGEEHEAVAEEHAHVLHVAHGAAHELPGRPAVEIAERLPQQVAPHAVAQVVLDAEARLAAGEAAAEGDDEAHDRDAQEGEAVGHEQARLAADQRVVDGQLDDARHQQAEAHLGEGEGEAHEGEPLVVAEQLEDAPEDLHQRLAYPEAKRPCGVHWAGVSRRAACGSRTR